MTTDKKSPFNKAITFNTTSTTMSDTSGLIFNDSHSINNKTINPTSSYVNEQAISQKNSISDNVKYDLPQNYGRHDYSETRLEEKLTEYYNYLKVDFDKESQKSQNQLFAHLQTAQKALDLNVNKVLSELKEVRNSVLGTIALFAAFFTFVSVNVNIFTKAESVLHALLFMFSMWLCIIGLISTFFYFLNTKKSLFFRSEFIITLICIILSGLVIYFLSTPYNDKKNIELKKQLDELNTQNKKINSNNDLLRKEIHELKNDIYELKKNQFLFDRQQP